MTAKQCGNGWVVVDDGIDYFLWPPDDGDDMWVGAYVYQHDA